MSKHELPKNCAIYERQVGEQKLILRAIRQDLDDDLIVHQSPTGSYVAWEDDDDIDSMMSPMSGFFQWDVREDDVYVRDVMRTVKVFESRGQYCNVCRGYVEFEYDTISTCRHVYFFFTGDYYGIGNQYDTKELQEARFDLCRQLVKVAPAIARGVCYALGSGRSIGNADGVVTADLDRFFDDNWGFDIDFDDWKHYQDSYNIQDDVHLVAKSLLFLNSIADGLSPIIATRVVDLFLSLRPEWGDDTEQSFPEQTIQKHRHYVTDIIERRRASVEKARAMDEALTMLWDGGAESLPDATYSDPVAMVRSFLSSVSSGCLSVRVLVRELANNMVPTGEDAIRAGEFLAALDGEVLDGEVLDGEVLDLVNDGDPTSRGTKAAREFVEQFGYSYDGLLQDGGEL